jgi:hypothetical protein
LEVVHAMAQQTRDRDIRPVLRSLLAARYAGDDTTLIVEEMGILWGDRRIDAAVINGELHGYEIKSDADDLSRLPEQAAAYARVFDRLTLVAGGRHLTAAVAILPQWWGVDAVEPTPDGVTLVEARPALLSPDRDPESIARLLWRDEAAAILVRRGATVTRASRRIDLQNQVARKVPFVELCAEVRAALKSRPDWRAAALPS